MVSPWLGIFLTLFESINFASKPKCWICYQLHLGTRLISIELYKMVDAECWELNAQLEELQHKALLDPIDLLGVH